MRDFGLDFKDSLSSSSGIEILRVLSGSDTYPERNLNRKLIIIKKLDDTDALTTRDLSQN